ncbi:hypothetical protein Q0Z83_064760 [Actinoplanes sichuanensis]|uniref:MauE/DoxX family redox-associated membrane protein n=1 Tax=Actinoplanes sichuanensis TaxID=512349 RepID=A0ABW4APD5_9ACTN|nr:MauE/DoxX family redox-associated membrane protein [Actinoplanes sichuanensis]BEL08285.1 hypothetical protein Q0Z83_064760 [Actinoplanes sichuanensis]
MTAPIVIALYTAWACRCLLAVVFAVSVLSKVRSATAFAEFRTAASVLSGSTGRRAAAAAIAVVGAEIAVVVGPAPWVFAVALVLLVAFTVALHRNGRSAAPVACRCFGSAEAATGNLPLLRNAVLLSAAAAGLGCSLAAPSRPPVADALVLAAGAVVVATGLVRLEHVVGRLTARI